VKGMFIFKSVESDEESSFKVGRDNISLVDNS
jgi:hypothetical protein